MTPDELKAILQVMRDFGVDNFELGPLKVAFGETRLVPIAHQEPPEERLARMKSDLKAAQEEQAELDSWST